MCQLDKYCIGWTKLSVQMMLCLQSNQQWMWGLCNNSQLDSLHLKCHQVSGSMSPGYTSCKKLSLLMQHTGQQDTQHTDLLVLTVHPKHSRHYI